MVIDIHTHIFPDKLAATTIPKLEGMSHTRAFVDGTAAGLRASMERAGVDVSLVLPVATNPRQVVHVNDSSARINDQGPETGIYSIGRVTAQAVPLALGIVPAGMEAKVAARLNDVVVEDGYTCDFGLLGSRYALRMLVKYGYVETAYKLATQTRRPSWGNWIVEGFTTPLETWALRENFSDSSANHVFFGDIAAWMQSDIAGINYDEQKPGFENIIIRPHFPAEMEWAEASYHSVRGVVRSAWHRSRNHIILEVTIPLNTTATIYTDGVYKIKGNGSTYRFVVNERAAAKYTRPDAER